ncbi:amidohydrolase [Actinomadura sp. GC306]|uniref:dihydroorotase n=1 Tax=Actinomadura sp. GC306 TaxID=2530367 RepID=UPI001045FFF4|nr:amidohydrolase family protein [Actinomadura sp. GC306]TDC62793.1 amidohydrolase [Actinomadura sp. GC306]
MSADLALHNAELVTPKGRVHAGVAVRDGKIIAIGRDADLPAAAETIDCGGRPVLPGIVDPHVHLGGGVPYEELCETESVSAAIGGITTLLQYKRSATSLLDTFEKEREVAAAHSSFDTAFHFILNSMAQIEEIPQYAERFGVRSFKFYMGGYPEGNPIGLVTVSDADLYEAMARIRGLGPYARCMVHCEDDALVEHLTEQVKASGRNDLAAYTDSRPGFVEEQDILRAIWLAELQKSPLYIPHTTIGAGIDAAHAARERGADIVLETCPHYLALTIDDQRLAEQGAGVGKVAPALRGEEDRLRLWDGLRDGSIKTIGSDHVPLVKTGAALWEEKPGFAGLATMLPVVLTEGVLKGRIELEHVAAAMAENPARIFGLYPRKGAIAVGADADFVVVDLDTERVVGPDVTRSKYTSAFEGMALKGWPALTIRRGEVQLRDGEVSVRPGSGQVLRP